MLRTGSFVSRLILAAAVVLWCVYRALTQPPVTMASTGELQPDRAAPVIRAVNAGGVNVPEGYTLRFRNGGFPSFGVLAQRDATTNGYVIVPVDLGPVGDDVFLVFYLTGIRQAGVPDSTGPPDNAVRVILGGTEFEPDFAGPSPYVGVDQINLRLPRTLIGRGRVGLSVVAGGLQSNSTEFEIAPQTASAAPAVDGFGSTETVAGARLIIRAAVLRHRRNKTRCVSAIWKPLCSARPKPNWSSPPPTASRLER